MRIFFFGDPPGSVMFADSPTRCRRPRRHPLYSHFGRCFECWGTGRDRFRRLECTDLVVRENSLISSVTTSFSLDSPASFLTAWGLYMLPFDREASSRTSPVSLEVASKLSSAGNSLAQLYMDDRRPELRPIASARVHYVLCSHAWRSRACMPFPDPNGVDDDNVRSSSLTRQICGISWNLVSRGRKKRLTPRRAHTTPPGASDLRSFLSSYFAFILRAFPLVPPTF